jgi:hypothetical protein
MARDSGRELFDLDTMTDDELRDLVVQQLREHPNIDTDGIDVDVRDGEVMLAGQVGTDGEVQIAEQVLSDVIGVESYRNELVVGASHRGQMPEAADASAAHDEATVDPLGDADPQQSDTAEHLVEDLASQTYGTQDIGQAVRDGTSYQPPDIRTPDGYGSREDH